MARLLVSVRSVAEALLAWEAGAQLIDVKEPGRGPLGRAEVDVWLATRQALPADAEVSVAPGELGDWLDGREGPIPSPRQLAGIAYRKIGLAGLGGDTEWSSRWAGFRRACGAGPPWIAVIYADWVMARSPHPELILAAALEAEDCAGLLIDTFDKSRPSPLEPNAFWWGLIEMARSITRRPFLIALAGHVDRDAIARLVPMKPDYFAIRGAACVGGRRDAPIDPERVRDLRRLL